MRLYTAYNGVAPTTAALAPVTTGTAIKTLLQLAPPSTLDADLIGWGISFDGATFGTKIKCELVETDVAATVVAHVAAGLVKVNGDALAASVANSQMTLGTAATGYTASAEGTTTTSRLFDYQQIDQSAGYSFTWPLGNYPKLQASKFLRVRVTTGTAVNAVCWVSWGE
jgi:hypothetical protein